MKLQETRKKQAGITLVALVVTIIILIILATVSLNATLGEDGLINQAKLAKLEYRASAVEEEVMMWKAEQEFASYQGTDSFKLKNALIEDQQARGLLTKEEAEIAKEKSVVTIGSRTISYEGEVEKTLGDAISSGRIFSSTVKYDASGNKIEDEEEIPAITVPAGFKIVEGSNIDDGIVIADAQGNEFVWVPCTVAEYKNHDYSGRANKEDTIVTLGDDGDGGWKTWYYTVYNDWNDKGGDEGSVQQYGGFYIARYEAGIPSTATDIYVNKNTAATVAYAVADKKNVNTYKPVSKKGAQAWNLISQTNAVTVSQNMYAENSSVTSQLVDGRAWDRTIDWIAKSMPDTVKDSTKYGNYCNTGELGKIPPIEISNSLYAEHLYRYKAQSVSTWCLAQHYQYGTISSGSQDPYTGGSAEKYQGYQEPADQYKYRHYVEFATGASAQTKLKNIYDLGGNMYEWTTETGNHTREDGSKSNDTYAVIRGGCFRVYGSDFPNSVRDGGFLVGDSYPDVGFRVVLYVK